MYVFIVYRKDSIIIYIYICIHLQLPNPTKPLPGELRAPAKLERVPRDKSDSPSQGALHPDLQEMLPSGELT